ncbi:unnamed protein product [Amoebophrya sp. A120]|nr:unnamed protein product [Amoebophrya sp. A120]|eukprot:GSA120T00001410001.1
MSTSLLRNNCTEDNLHCTPAIPNIITNPADIPTGGKGNKHPIRNPLFAKDAWNEREWHSMRKALNAARIADNAVREAYRYAQWSRDRSGMVKQYARKALETFDQEFGPPEREMLTGSAASSLQTFGQAAPLQVHSNVMPEFQTAGIRTAHWF